jgi:hypothetical protein
MKLLRLWNALWIVFQIDPIHTLTIGYWNKNNSRRFAFFYNHGIGSKHEYHMFHVLCFSISFQKYRIPKGIITK